jgi:diguanylate cyclase (GGDEF)-like protein
LHDELTGLPNRVLLRDRTELAIGMARRSRSQVALIYLDLDHFKSVNDTFGHDAGDEVLTVVAQRLRATLRPADTVARLGGDEFVACCPDITPRAAEDLAERLVHAVSRPVPVGNRLVPVSISAGLTLSRAGDSAATLLTQGDTAMYAAKKSGRGHVQSYADELTARATRQVILVAELRDALDQEQFVLHYQPIVDIATGTIIACEALARWQHPTRGLLPPGEWLDVMEQSDLMIAFGEWVLRRACHDMASVAEQVHPLMVHVNVSGRQFEQAGMVDQVTAALRDSGLPSHLVVLELTETRLLEIHHSLLTDFERIHRLGLQIAVDDFGTGYSSLTQLVSLPVDQLKIDRSFVSAASDGERAGAVVRGILGMAEALGLSVIAEGVETPAQAAMMQDLGCVTAQGCLWSPPLELSRLQAMLSRGPLRELEAPPAQCRPTAP